MTLKDLIKDNKAIFSYYRAGNLFYQIAYENNVYSFSIPIEDIGDATFLAEEKAILMMRYIRKAMETNTLIKN